MNLGDVFVNFSSNINNFTTDLREVNFELSVMASLAKTTEQQVRAFMVAAFYLGKALMTVMLDSVNSFGEVEQGISDLRTVLDGTIEAFESLKQTAVDWSNVHVTSTEEVVSSMYDMASAGLDQEEILVSVGKAATLATATMGDMEQATSLMTNTINSFGKVTAESMTPLQQANDYMNTFAYTVQSFKIILPELEEGMSRAAGAATALGANVQDVSVALGAVKTAGLSASRAGTALKNFYERLAKVSQDTGLALRDSNGELLSVAEIIQELRDYYGGSIDTMQEFADVQTLLGKRGSQVVTLLQNQVKSLLEHEKAVKNSAVATEMAAEREKGFAAQMKILQNRVENLKIAFGESLLPMIEYFSSQVSELTLGLVAMDEESRNTWSGLIQGLSGVTIGLGLVTPAIIGLRHALIALAGMFKVVAAAGSTALAVINGLAFGIPAVITAIALFTTSLFKNKGAAEEARIAQEELEKENKSLAQSFIGLADQFNNATDGGKDFKDVTDDTVENIRELSKSVPGFTDVLTMSNEEIKSNTALMKELGEEINRILELKEKYLKGERTEDISILQKQVDKDKEAVAEMEVVLNDFEDLYDSALKDNENSFSRLFNEDEAEIVANYAESVKKTNEEYKNTYTGITELVGALSLLIKKAEEHGAQIYDENGQLLEKNQIIQNIIRTYLELNNQLTDRNKVLDETIAKDELLKEKNRELLSTYSEEVTAIQDSNMSMKDKLEALENLKEKIEDNIMTERKEIDNLYEYSEVYPVITKAIKDLNTEREKQIQSFADLQYSMEQVAEENERLEGTKGLQGLDDTEVLEKQIANQEEITNTLREQIALKDNLTDEIVKEYDMLKSQEKALESSLNFNSRILSIKKRNGEQDTEAYKNIEDKIKLYRLNLEQIKEKLENEKFSNMELVEMLRNNEEIAEELKNRLRLQEEINELEEYSIENLKAELSLIKEIAEVEGKNRLETLKAQLSLTNQQIDALKTQIAEDGKMTSKEKEKLEALVAVRDELKSNISGIEARNDAIEEAHKKEMRMRDDQRKALERYKQSIESLNESIIKGLQDEEEYRQRNFEKAYTNYQKLANLDLDFDSEDAQLKYEVDLSAAKEEVLKFGEGIVSAFSNTTEELKGSVNDIDDTLSNMDFEKYGIDIGEYNSFLADTGDLLSKAQSTAARVSMDGVVTPEELVELNNLNSELKNVSGSLQEYTQKLEEHKAIVSNIIDIQKSLESSIKENQIEFSLFGDKLDKAEDAAKSYEQALNSLIQQKANVDDPSIAAALDEEINKMKELYEQSKSLAESYQLIESSMDSMKSVQDSVSGSLEDLNQKLNANDGYVYDSSDAVREIDKDLSVYQSTLSNLQSKLEKVVNIYDKLAEALKNAKSDEEAAAIKAAMEKVSGTAGNLEGNIDNLKSAIKNLEQERAEAFAKTFIEDFREIGKEVNKVSSALDEFIDKVMQEKPETVFGEMLQDIDNYRDDLVDTMKEQAKYLDEAIQKRKEYRRAVEAGEAAWNQNIWDEMTNAIQRQTLSLNKNKQELRELQEGYKILSEVLQTFNDLAQKEAEDTFPVEEMVESFENLDPDLSKWDIAMSKLEKSKDEQVKNFQELGEKANEAEAAWNKYIDAVNSGKIEEDPEVTKKLEAAKDKYVSAFSEAEKSLEEFMESFFRDRDRIKTEMNISDTLKEAAREYRDSIYTASQILTGTPIDTIDQFKSAYAEFADSIKGYNGEISQSYGETLDSAQSYFSSMVSAEKSYVDQLKGLYIEIRNNTSLTAERRAEVLGNLNKDIEEATERLEKHEKRLEGIEFDIENKEILDSLQENIVVAEEFNKLIGDTEISLDELSKGLEDSSLSTDELSNAISSLENKSNKYEQSIKELVKQKNLANKTSKDGIVWGEKEEQMLQSLVGQYETYQEAIAQAREEMERMEEEERQRQEFQESVGVGTIDSDDPNSYYTQYYPTKEDYEDYEKREEEFTQKRVEKGKEIISSLNKVATAQDITADSALQAGKQIDELNDKWGRFPGVANAVTDAYKRLSNVIYKSAISALNDIKGAMGGSSDDIEGAIEDLDEWAKKWEQVAEYSSQTADLLDTKSKVFKQLVEALNKALQSEIVEEYNDAIHKLNTEFALFGDELEYVDGQISAIEDRIGNLIDLKLRALKDENVEWTSELEQELQSLVGDLQGLQEEYDALAQKQEFMSDISGGITSGIQSIMDEFFDLVQEFGSEEAWKQVKGKLEKNIKRNIINAIMKSLLETAAIKDQIKELTEFIVTAMEDGLQDSEFNIMDNMIAGIQDSVKGVAGVVGYITEAMGLAGDASQSVSESLNQGLVTLEEARSGKFDEYFREMNKKEQKQEIESRKSNDYLQNIDEKNAKSNEQLKQINEKNIMPDILRTEELNLQVQRQSNKYLQQMAYSLSGSREDNSDSIESGSGSNNYDMSNMTFNIEGSNIEDAETLALEIKPILEREFDFDSRVNGR